MRTVEMQLWQLTLEEERKRVEELHDDARRQGKKSAAEFNPKRIEKPWSWQNNWRKSLFDIPRQFVLSVADFDFNLNDEGFKMYLEKYNLLHIIGHEGSSYWKCLNDHNMHKERFMAVEELRYAQKYEGKRHRYSDTEMQSRWEIFQFSRVRLQAAWDAYTERRQPENAEEVLSGS